MQSVQPLGTRYKAVGVSLRQKREAVYRHEALRRVLSPRHVAIIGASSRAGAFGDRVLRNLSGFSGDVHLVNPRYDRIGTRECFPSVSALPVVPDCAVIAMARDAVEEAVVECAALGVGGLVIFASGYAETAQPDLVAAQERLSDIARQSGIRIIGPNCLGVLNYLNGLALTFTDQPREAVAHGARIGMVSQSGAIGFALAQAAERGVCFSHVLTAGNSCDVDAADQIAYLADDSACKVIACAFEGLASPQRLMQAGAAAWAANKPLIFYKMATGNEGAATALSHTGSLAGSAATYRAMFDRMGAIVVDDYDALIQTAAFFAKASAPRAEGVVVVSTSGGAAVIAADRAEQYQVALPQPGVATLDLVRQHLPEFGAPWNPFDMTGQILNNPNSLGSCADLLLADPAYGALIMPLVIAYDVAVPRIAAVGRAAASQGKIACVVWISEWVGGPGSLEAEIDPAIGVFRSMRFCLAALSAWHDRERRRGKGARDLTRRSVETAYHSARSLLDQAGSTLSEREAKRVLSLYGLHVVPEKLVRTAEEAQHAAADYGYPVVLKIESPDLLHKTEVGGIRLNLSTPDDVRLGFDALMAEVMASASAARISGVIVQPMVSQGTEILLGAKIDPPFDPVIVVGLGGTMVELLQDTVAELAPVTHDEAVAMLQRLRTAAVLTGYRGRPGVDLARLADTICRFGEFVSDHRDVLAEVDINPLICSGDQMIAVDALISTRG